MLTVLHSAKLVYCVDADLFKKKLHINDLFVNFSILNFYE